MVFIVLFVLVLAFGIPVANIFSASAGITIPLSWYTTAIIIGLLLLCIVIVPKYIYEYLYFKTYYYDLNENFIVIKKGVITNGEISIPYERIQDVYVDQDIWDRIFGIYDVHLSTATWTSGMEAHIDGLEKVAAEGLRELLLTTLKKKISKKPAMKQIPFINNDNQQSNK